MLGRDIMDHSLSLRADYHVRRGVHHTKHDCAHSLSFHRCCRGARTSPHRLIRYPFGGTSIVPFDVYGLGRPKAPAATRAKDGTF